LAKNGTPNLLAYIFGRISLVPLSRDLSKKRGPALYGYEAQLRPASDIFSRNDAEEALMYADDVYNSCNRLISEIFEGDT
jgi:hypothetical protein